MNILFSFISIVYGVVPLSQISKDEVWIVLFSADWCGPCKKVKPKFALAAERMKSIIRFGRVDCVADLELCMEYNVVGMPTILALGGTLGDEVVPFSGNREEEDLVNFANSIAHTYFSRPSRTVSASLPREPKKTVKKSRSDPQISKKAEKPIVDLDLSTFDLKAWATKIVEFKGRDPWAQLGGASIVKKLETDGINDATWSLFKGAMMLAGWEIRRKESKSFVDSTRLKPLIEKSWDFISSKIYSEFNHLSLYGVLNENVRLSGLLRAPFWKLGSFLDGNDLKMKRLLLAQRFSRRISRNPDVGNMDLLRRDFNEGAIEKFVSTVLSQKVGTKVGDVFMVNTKMNVESKRHVLLAVGRLIGVVFMTGKVLPVKLDTRIYNAMIKKADSRAMRYIRIGFYDVVPLHLKGRVTSGEELAKMMEYTFYMKFFPILLF